MKDKNSPKKTLTIFEKLVKTAVNTPPKPKKKKAKK
jgi:hypothetical protein